MRAFIAIRPPDEIVKSIENITKSLAPKFPKINWEIPDKTHITIVFFGSIMENRLEYVSQVLREITQNTSPFPLKVAYLSYFHKRHDDSIVFLDIEDETRELRTLYNELKRRLDEEKFFFPERLSLHITIGRLKRTRKLHESKRILTNFARTDILEVGEFTVDSINIYESLYSSDADTTRYRLLESFPLFSQVHLKRDCVANLKPL